MVIARTATVFKTHIQRWRLSAATRKVAARPFFVVSFVLALNRVNVVAGVGKLQV